MKFCTQCGNKSEDSNKFCQECGALLSGNYGNTNTTTQRFPFSNAKREALLKLSNFFIWLYWSAPVLMNFQEAGGWSSSLCDLTVGEKVIGVIFGFVLLAILYGVYHFCVSVQCIEKEKPNWALWCLLIFSSLTIWSWSESVFANYNWADWLSEVIGIVQLVLIFLIWLKGKAFE